MQKVLGPRLVRCDRTVNEVVLVLKELLAEPHKRSSLQSYGNQSTDLQSHSIDWFLYEWNIDIKQVNYHI